MQTLPNYEIKRMIGSGAFGNFFNWINFLLKDLFLKLTTTQRKEK